MGKTIMVGAGRYEGQTNAAIQRALDEAAAGDVVRIGAGNYILHDALHLRAGVRLIGEDGAVLRKAASQESRILDFLGYGHYEVTVAEPEKFPVGSGIHILDDSGHGFYTTVGTVVGRDGERLFINRMLNHDYHPTKNGRAVSVFPVVEGDGVSDVVVENLVLDGNADAQSMTLNGCRGGGVFLIGCQRVVLRGLTVRNYRGDSVSFQQCADIRVERCRIHDNTGHGLHPGSGSVRYVMEENEVHNNGDCGLFYCLRTTHAICRGNRLRDNGKAGISVGERDTDHLIIENTIAGNGGEGILFRRPERRGGDRVVVRQNQIGPDARAEIAIPAGLCDLHIVENTLKPGAGGAIHVGGDTQRVHVAGNRISGRAQAAADLGGPGAGQVLLSVPAQPLAVGPAPLPLDEARHLNIARLEAWK